MNRKSFIHRSQIPLPAEAVFAWHTRPGVLQRLTPPWENVRVLRQNGGVEDGGRVELQVKLGPWRRTWLAEHRRFEPGRSFQDVQLEGPFAHWEHTHRIQPDGPAACVLEDQVEYALPLGAAGDAAAGRLVRSRLERMFRYRHEVTRCDTLAHARQKGGQMMKVLVSGSSGLVGSQLVPFLTSGGHTALRLVRSTPSGDDELQWDARSGPQNPQALEGLDGVVHLAGENIASGRWTDDLKRRIRDSRVEGTRVLCEALAARERPPRVLVCASAIGYYGDRGSDVMTEDSGPGNDFLAGVCREWEAACEPARQKGIRVVNLRIGVVLSPRGGALAKMLTPFRLGGGGVVGSGAQYMSWIAVDDVVGALHHCLTHDELSGPVNGAAPAPVTNREFTKTLGRVLHRPTIVPLPAFAARLAFGEMADALLLASTRVLPQKLEESGYEFRCPELEGALRHVLGR